MSKKIENYESIREKLLKLQALVERGYRGEADNARRILDKLCAKYGVSLKN